MSDRTPTLEDVIDQAIDDRLVDLHTCLPAIVESYDPATQTVMAKIGLMRKYGDGVLRERPIIPDVRVKFPKGSKFSLTHPIAKGDNGFLMFSERSLEKWRAGSGIVDPSDARKFHLSDCFFIPMASRDADLISGVSATKVQLKNDKSVFEMDEVGNVVIKNDVATANINANGNVKINSGAVSIELSESGLLELKNASGKIRMTSNGKFKIEGSKELLEIIGRFIDTMNTATTLTAFGLQPFFPPTPAQLTQLKTDILAITE